MCLQHLTNIPPGLKFNGEVENKYDNKVVNPKFNIFPSDVYRESL